MHNRGQDLGPVPPRGREGRLAVFILAPSRYRLRHELGVVFHICTVET